MSLRNGLSSTPSPMPQEVVIQEVLTCFDVYARVRGARDSVLAASRADPREEERAFSELRQAITRLRATSRPG